MRSFIALPLLWALLAVGFWYSLTGTLTDMAQRDCAAGVWRACQFLQSGRVQP